METGEITFEARDYILQGIQAQLEKNILAASAWEVEKTFWVPELRDFVYVIRGRAYYIDKFTCQLAPLRELIDKKYKLAEKLFDVCNPLESCIDAARNTMAEAIASQKLLGKLEGTE